MTTAAPVPPTPPAPPPEPDVLLAHTRHAPAPVRVAMAALEHFQWVRVPCAEPEIGAPDCGRNLDPREHETESAALELLRDYFAICRQQMLDSDE